MRAIFQNIFAWYKRNYKLNLYIATGLFLWQLVHLYWLTTNIVMLRIFGREFWDVGAIGNILISLVDYTEIPAIILSSIFYFSEYVKGSKFRSVLFLTLINIQWLHLFWITDEVVVKVFTGGVVVGMPVWLSWAAILIDYLELPVIYDTVKKSIKSLRKSA